MSEDLIKREDAIKALYKYSFVSKDVIEREIKAIPSADRPHGEWTNAGMLTVHCSNCKSEFHELEAMNFCPNCGAKMKGADDE